MLPLVAALQCSADAITDPPPTVAAAPAPVEAPPADHVIVIVLDGVRAHEVFEGADPALSPNAETAESIAPNLDAMKRRGFALGGRGAPIRASGPNYVSLPGYIELLSGAPSRCQENDCDLAPPVTLFDLFPEPVGDGSVALVGSWGRLAALLPPGEDKMFVSVGRDRIAGHDELALDPVFNAALARGREVAPYPGWGDYRPDERTIEVALETMRAARPRFFFVSLGDADEHGHAGNYTGYLDAIRRADRFIGDVRRIAESWEREGQSTSIFVTTDHGRSHALRDHGREHQESSEVWLVAAGARLPALGEVALDGELALADIAPLVVSVAGLTVPRTFARAELATALMNAAAADGGAETAERNVALR